MPLAPFLVRPTGETATAAWRTKLWTFSIWVRAHPHEIGRVHHFGMFDGVIPLVLSPLPSGAVPGVFIVLGVQRIVILKIAGAAACLAGRACFDVGSGEPIQLRNFRSCFQV
jgi:hypothetical protein